MPKIMDTLLAILSVSRYWAIVLDTLEVQVDLKNAWLRGAEPEQNSLSTPGSA